MTAILASFKKCYSNILSKDLIKVTLAIFLLLSCWSCTPPDIHTKSSCQTCHNVILDANHNFKCIDCHKGNNQACFEEKAHKGLIKSPASPDNAKAYCGRCHLLEVNNVLHSIHYTLNKEISLVWKAFFPSQQPPPLKKIRGISRPKNPSQLLEDLLARRCLRCHVYYEGDDYKGTRRGKGCAACHMSVTSKNHHNFKAPTIENCLSCHYANFVGWDYVGRFEKDYPEDFRSPLQRGKHIQRPYGIEWIQMTPDVHFMAGMTCIDCHKKTLFHVKKGKTPHPISCKDCHNKLTPIPGHDSSSKCKAECQTCHALWAVWDQGRSLIRQDDPDLEEWQFLAIQGSSEIEYQVSKYVNASNDSSFKPTMSDKIHSQDLPGLWFAALEKRRWAPVILGKDSKGTLSVMRPLLDLTLSFADAYGETVLDNIKARGRNFFDLSYPDWFLSNEDFKVDPSLCLPYHPHTISKADIMRTIFVEKYLNQCAIDKIDKINQKTH